MERHDRTESVPAERDISEITYNAAKQSLSVKYHVSAGRIVFATRRYSNVAHGEGVDDEVEWNAKNHAIFHVRPGASTTGGWRGCIPPII